MSRADDFEALYAAKIHAEYAPPPEKEKRQPPPCFVGPILKILESNPDGVSKVEIRRELGLTKGGSRREVDAALLKISDEETGFRKQYGLNQLWFFGPRGNGFTQ